MIGTLEILLLLAPFLLYGLWRVLTPMLAPVLFRRAALWGALALVAMLAASGAWYATRAHLAPGAHYQPPHVENGVVVPGRGR